jgi:hypothetical protein
MKMPIGRKASTSPIPTFRLAHKFSIDRPVEDHILPNLRLPVILTPFEDKYIPLWQQAVDNAHISPSPLGGPEFNLTTIRGWGKTFVLMANNLMIPVAREETTHFRIVKSDVYTGVLINSLLGITQMNDQIWSDLAELPRRCVVILDVPEQHYDGNKERWQALGFYPTQRTTYHKIDLPTSYDEWFSRPGVRRQNIRRAREGGLTVAFGGREMLEAFYELYLDSFARWQSRQVATRAHDYVRFQRLFDSPGSQVQLAAVKFEDRIAAAAIFCCYSRTAGFLYGGANSEYQQLRPNNLLHAEIIRYLIERGVSEYNLGNSLNLKDLEHFKESLGANRHHSVTLCRDRFPRLKQLLRKGSAS